MGTVCFGSNNGGLPFGPYKQVVAVESLNNFSNNKPHDPHGFKEEIKIKFNAVKAVVGKFSNGTGSMMELLKAEVPTLDWAIYFALPVTEQLV